MRFDTPSMIDTLSPDAGAQTQRRHLLALLISAPLLPSVAQAVAQAAAGGKLMTLSKFATGRPELDASVGTALFAALRDSDPSLGAALDSLAADASSGKYSDVESLETAVRGTPKHAALLALVSAWYSGTVIVKGKPRFITLTNALLYEPIADGSHVPGNCAGATNSWANQPAPALAAMPSRKI